MRKGIVAISVMFVFSTINIYFSTIVYRLLERIFEGVKTVDFNGCISSIIKNQNHFTIFISIEIFIMLGIALLMLNRFGDYKSKVQKITPKIKTPVAAGQMQHGSSRWLKKSEYRKAFKAIIIDRDSPLIKHLMDCGKSDFKKIQAYVNEENQKNKKEGGKNN